MAVVSANRSYSFGKQSRRCADGRKNNSGRRMRNRFLTAKIKSIPGYELPFNGAIVCGEPDRCIAYLVSSLKFFYNEFGIECDLPETTGNFQLDLKALYIHLCEHVPNWKVDCVKTNDKEKPFRFVVYDEKDDFPYWTIWTVPINKLDNFDKRTRELLIMTFAMLHGNDMFLFPEDNYDFLYSLGQLDCDSWGKEKLEVDMDALDQWGDDWVYWAERYVIGDIYSLFKEIHSVEKETECICDKVIELAKSLRSSDYTNYGLLSAIEDVAELCKTGWLSDYHIGIAKNIYGDDFGSNEYECGMMDFGRLFTFCYKLDDPIVEYMIDMFNANYGDIDVGILMNHSYIDDPGVKSKMHNKFCAEWAEKMENLIEELE